MPKYYIIINGQQEGPFSLEELKTKSIAKETPVWYEGLPDWQDASQVKELAVLWAPSPPPFKTIREETGGTLHRAVPEYKGQPIDNPYVTKKRRFSPSAVWGIAGGAALIILLSIMISRNNTSSNVASASTPVTETTGPTQTELQQLKQKVQEQEQAEAAKKKRNDELTAKNMNIRNNWFSFFTEEPFGYSISELGGVAGLQFAITNHSEYTVDQVDVTAFYYLANGNFHGTNTGTVYNLAPGETRAVKVPNTGRGTRFEHRITKIVGSRFHFLYSENYHSGNPEDPYYNK